MLLAGTQCLALWLAGPMAQKSTRELVAACQWLIGRLQQQKWGWPPGLQCVGDRVLSPWFGC